MADHFGLGDKLAKLRAEKQLTLDEVAEGLNVARSTYYDYEQGNTIPKLEFIQKIAAFYEVDPMDLLSGTKFTINQQHNQVANGYVNQQHNGDPRTVERMWSAMMERTKSLEDLLAKTLATLERMSKREGRS